jgi:general nucleoside transport system permease protein
VTDQPARPGTGAEAPPRGRRIPRGPWSLLAVPVLSVLLALVVGAIIIIVSSPAIKGHLDLLLPIVAYKALLEGSLGSVNAIVNTIVQAAPLILGGLAVGIGFKAGLFNIGAQGQFLIGGLGAAVVGGMVAGWPPLAAIAIAVLAGAFFGALWGFIPGALKAWTGAHEVVTTIMLNYIGASLIGILVAGPLGAPGFSFARTGDIGGAALPIIFGRNLHVGVLLAFAAVPAAWWLIWRTTLGFEIRTVGANPNAARYSGMRPGRLIVLTLTLCGMLAGLAASIEILGVSGFMGASYGTSIGFDSISIALLGRAHPVGIMAASLLFGAMRAGSGLMQIQAGVPVEIVDVVQAIILLFLAADVIVRRLFGVRAARGGVAELKTVTESYGEQTAAS